MNFDDVVRFRDYLGGPYLAAPLFLVTADMVRLLAAAVGAPDAPTITLGEPDLYTPGGVLGLEAAMPVRDGKGVEPDKTIDAIAWMVSGVDTAPLLPVGQVFTSCYDLVTMTEHTTPNVLFYALHYFLRDRLVRFRDETHAARSRNGQRIGTPPATVSIVTLRGSEYRPRKDEPGFVDWSHRWLVRGTWVHRQNGNVHYRHEHVKGPADKPLVVKDRRYRWSR